MNEIDLNTAIIIAQKFIRPAEACSLIAYPDSSSPLSKALSEHNLLHDFMAGKFQIPDYMLELSGAPISIGWGQTGSFKLGDTCTQEQADAWLYEAVKTRAEDILEFSPVLDEHSPEKLAAAISLVYNIGLANYKTSSVAKAIAKGDFLTAQNSFALWNKDRINGVLQVVPGLVNRRAKEAALFGSVRN